MKHSPSGAYIEREEVPSPNLKRDVYIGAARGKSPQKLKKGVENGFISEGTIFSNSFSKRLQKLNFSVESLSKTFKFF